MFSLSCEELYVVDLVSDKKLALSVASSFGVLRREYIVFEQSNKIVPSLVTDSKQQLINIVPPLVTDPRQQLINIVPPLVTDPRKKLINI